MTKPFNTVGCNPEIIRYSPQDGRFLYLGEFALAGSWVEFCCVFTIGISMCVCIYIYMYVVIYVFVHVFVHLFICVHR